MKCPHCKDIDLIMTVRNNIEIDYCPKCRGIWLDRGELDKIIEASAKDIEVQNKNYEKNYYEHEEDKHYNKKRKKESFLGELFDFDFL